MKGGKLMGFRCTAVVGNQAGLVGVGCAAGREVATAVKRALVDAKKSVVIVSLRWGGGMSSRRALGATKGVSGVSCSVMLACCWRGSHTWQGAGRFSKTGCACARGGSHTVVVEVVVVGLWWWCGGASHARILGRGGSLAVLKQPCGRDHPWGCGELQL